MFLNIVQNALPQSMEDTTTIIVALKIQLEYKNVFQTGKVCVHNVMKALKELCSRNLYKSENTSISRNWDNILQSTLKTKMK